MSLYPIRTLAELTGVPGVTLRAWERRYGLLKPRRTPKGHRLYSDEDIALIRRVVDRLQQGYSISDVARQLAQGDDIQPSTTSTDTGSEWQALQTGLLRQIEAFNEDALDNLYNQALSLYPVDLVTRQVILPVLKTLGDRWSTRPAGIAEEHFFSAYLRNKLGARIHHESRQTRGKRLLVACLPGEHHELGLLLFALAALARGYRMTYLGPNLPLRQVAAVLAQKPFDAILLSGSSVEMTGELQIELATCARQSTLPVFMGGEFSDRERPQLEALGIIALGADHAGALLKLEHRLPALTGR